MAINRKLWGRTPDGKPIYKYTLTNASGASVVLGSIGAAIVSVNVPDRDGKLADVALGYGKAESYFADGPCAGKCPGRYANRIAGGRLKIAGKEYKLPNRQSARHSGHCRLYAGQGSGNIRRPGCRRERRRPGGCVGHREAGGKLIVFDLSRLPGDVMISSRWGNVKKRRPDKK